MMSGRGRRGARPKEDESPIPDTPIRWRRLFSYLRPYLGYMLIAFIALLVSTGIGLAFPLVIGQLLESALAKGVGYDALNRLALSLIALFALSSIFTTIQGFTLSYVGERIVLDLRQSLYRQLNHLSLDFFATRRTGELITRISTNVTGVRSLLTTEITSAVTQIFSLVGSIVIVFLINPNLSAFILVLLPIILVVAIVFGRPLQQISTRINDLFASAMGDAEEALGGVRIVRSFHREDHEVERFNTATQNAFSATLRGAAYRSAFGGVMAFLGFGALAAILWFGGREVIEGRLTLSMIAVFLIYGVTIAAGLGSLAGFYTNVRQSLGEVRRVFEILDMEPTIQDKPGAKALPPVAGRITFDQVGFHYDTKIEVLKAVSLDVAPGEIVALVGPSGAGKTTMFNLIPRFYDVNSGAVRVDGHDVRDVTQGSLREQIGMVPQETLLFSGSILENIQYGRLGATEADVIEAAKAANAHEFIIGFPDGYQSKVGERGIKLSGGQRQRIAIARAILKNPRILLLDEATSALDNESEHLVQDALERLMQNRTTVIIAHRLSTIKVAHRIAVLDAGRLVELGTHDELMAKDGLYARLYSMQFRDTDLVREPQPG